MGSVTDDRLLTYAELELMNVLWARGSATAREVHDALPGRAYTTVATILKILEEKGFAAAERAGRAFRYTPRVTRDAYQARSLRHVVSEVYRGDRVALVRQLVVADSLDPDEIEALRALVEGLDP